MRRERAVVRYQFVKFAVLSATMFGVMLGASDPAQARREHTRPHAAAPVEATDSPSAGFGPTSAGVSDILIDAKSGDVIAANGADVPRYPASLTKLMTIDLTFAALRANRLTLDTLVPVSSYAASVSPVKLGLTPASRITVRQAILAMATMSANDAATALGELVGGGSEAGCAVLMNQRARQLGMAQTTFANASGLPNPNQVTTARNLAVLARDIVTNYPEYQYFFEVQKFDLNGHQIYSNNTLLKTYSGATGMKTGWTILARHNLIASAERDGKTVIGVELHESSWGETYQQMAGLLDTGFNFLGVAPEHLVPSRNPALNQAAAATDHAKKTMKITSVDNVARWAAEIGPFSRLGTAKHNAAIAHNISGAGLARITRLTKHGKTEWNVRLAGLTKIDAEHTCLKLGAQGQACVILPPKDDHLAAAALSNQPS